MTRAADTIVIGTGVIGLSTANALARRGRSVMLIGEHRSGEASAAAAGMLAPSVERSDDTIAFNLAARDLYPDFLENIADTVGVRVPLNRLGVLQVALTERGVRGLRRTAPPTSRWLERAELTELEPTLGHALGAVFNPDDGSVDNVVLMSALDEQAEASDLITRLDTSVTSVSRERAAIQIASGDWYEGENVVVAAGAWSAGIAGATAMADVSPCRGQLTSYHSIGLRHVTYGPRGYLVPRTSGVIVAGSTMEYTGFDVATTPGGLAKVKAAAEEIAPALAISPVVSEWAGLRPVTPDMLPIIGADPQSPHIIYAAGHSRNGILLAPITALVVSELACGEAPSHDITRFRSGRF
ncbi:MAG: FAD-dependent oxidoreductase [Gemmatimonadaceae bacterium]